jgi:hypothetical protein
MTPSTSESPSTSSPIQGSLAKDRLGVLFVAFFVMSAAAPLTVVAGVANTQVLGIPIAFFTIAVILHIFSVGYVAMSRHITNAGAFYTVIYNTGLASVTGNAIVGTGTGWETGLSYVKGQAVNTTGQSTRGAGPRSGRVLGHGAENAAAGLAARQCELAVRA